MEITNGTQCHTKYQNLWKYPEILCGISTEMSFYLLQFWHLKWRNETQKSYFNLFIFFIVKVKAVLLFIHYAA